MKNEDHAFGYLRCEEIDDDKAKFAALNLLLLLRQNVQRLDHRLGRIAV